MFLLLCLFFKLINRRHSILINNLACAGNYANLTFPTPAVIPLELATAERTLKEQMNFSPSVRLALPSQNLPLAHLTQTHTDCPYTLAASSTTSLTFQDQPPSHIPSISFSPFQIRHSRNATSSAPPSVCPAQGAGINSTLNASMQAPGPKVIHTSIPDGRSALDTQYFNHLVAQVASHFKDQQILSFECSILMKRLGSR